MQHRIDRHTKMVAWAKIALPLFALGLLSTLFLLSRSVDPIASIPFSESDLATRTEGQQISEPQVYGVSPRGDLISLSAALARQSPETSDVMLAENVRAEIKLASGQTVDLRTKTAAINDSEGAVELTGAVTLDTSTGYSFRTQGITLSLTSLGATSNGPVTGAGPFGTVSAGRLELSAPDGEKAAQIFLKDGVKLVYTPIEKEE